MPQPREIVSDRSRFRALWARHLLPGATDNSDSLYQLLMDAYSEPQRVYHTLEHIEHCMKLFDSVYDRIDDADAVELSIWFHDVVYEPGAKDNEVLSARLFMEQSKGVFEDEFRRRVEGHIMATLHCGHRLTDYDSKYMVDIDLSSFGMPWAEFKHDSDKVRKEMQHQSDREFYARQASFQRGLLSQPRFYQTDYFFDKLELQARQNLEEYFKWVEKINPIS
ncbi:MAG: metal-dependent hydrolase [Pseudomonadota bacterium]